MIHSLLALALLAASFDAGKKGALQEWAKSDYTKPAAAAPSLPKEKKPSLAENLNSGSYLKLTDGSIWNVRPQDTMISQGWITEVEIEISSSGNPQYPYKLTNSLSKSSVLANKATSVPGLTPPPAPPNPNSPASTPTKK